MKVQIKNYQAIKEAELVFDKGITAIVGPTNSGKSSILRAIKGAVNNQAGNTFINYEADESEVIIEDNGNNISWIKHKKNPAKYIINGVEKSKIGRAQDDEVAELLNLREVDIEGQKARLNFWEQMEKAFLMDKTPSQLFNFIAYSKEQELISLLDSTKKTELTSTKDEIKTKNTEINLTNTYINSNNDTLNNLEKYLSFDVNKLELLTNIYEGIYKGINNLNNLRANKTELVNTVTNLNTVTQEASEVVSNINTKLANLEALQRTLSKLEQAKNIVLVNTTELERLKTNLNADKQRIDEVTVLINAILDKQTKVVELNNQLIKLNQIKNNSEQIIINIEAVKEKVNSFRKELNDFTVCPYCGSDISDNSQHIHN